MDRLLDNHIREWKKSNPDWLTYLSNPPSYNDHQRVHQRRGEVYKMIGELGITRLQRELNLRGLPYNPKRGHWDAFFLSEAITLNQQARGQYLPFHEEMESYLERVAEYIDHHFLGYAVGGTLAYAKDHLTDWFDTHVRQPAQEAWAFATNSQRQSRRTW